MAHLFEPGNCQDPFLTLVRDVVDATAFSTKDLRTG